VSVLLDDDDEVTPGLLPDGRPDPEYPASLGILPAPLGRRAAAFALDSAFFVVLLLPLLVGAVPRVVGILSENPNPALIPAHPDFLVALIFYAIGQGLATIFTIVQLILHGTKGLTAGKAIVGIRSVNVATFAKPGFWRIVLRALVLSAAFTIVPYLGAAPFLLSPLWDPEKRGRGWLDRIGRNWFIDVKRGLNPYDLRALRLARRALTAPKLREAEVLPSLATGTAWGGPAFVPSARSSSGVVSAAPSESPAQQWEAPGIAAPTSEPAAPVIPTPSRAAPASPAVTGPPAAAPAVHTPGASRAAQLVFADGLVLDVRGDGLLGRNPEARPGENLEHLYRIDDPERQLSKTHLAFGIDDSGVWIEDCGSSNGTFVTTDSGAVLALEPRKKSRVAPGSSVEIGDRTFTVRHTP